MEIDNREIDLVKWNKMQLMMSHHAETRGIYLFAQYTTTKTFLCDVDQPV